MRPEDVGANERLRAGFWGAGVRECGPFCCAFYGWRGRVGSLVNDRRGRDAGGVLLGCWLPATRGRVVRARARANPAPRFACAM